MKNKEYNDEGFDWSALAVKLTPGWAATVAAMETDFAKDNDLVYCKHCKYLVPIDEKHTEELCVSRIDVKEGS